MFLIIDGGTTNLRVTLLSDERKPLDAIARDGGVRHTAVDGNNGRLKAALAECIDQLLARNGLDAGDVKRCVAYGMITRACLGRRFARRDARAALPGDRAVPDSLHPRRAQLCRAGRSG